MLFLIYPLCFSSVPSLTAQLVKNPPAMWEKAIRFLALEGMLKKG